MASDNEVGGWVIDKNNPNRATYTDVDGTIYEAFKDAPTSPATPSAPAATKNIAPKNEQTVVPVEQSQGMWDRFSSNMQEASTHGFPGWVARKWYDWTDYGVKDLIKKGYSPEEAEQLADKAIGEAQKQVSQTFASQRAKDPTWRPDQSAWENIAAIDRWGPGILGSVLGSTGPETFIAPGSSVAGRVAAQGALGAGTDSLYQASELQDNARDSYDPLQTVEAGASGAAFQGLLEGAGKAVKGLGKQAPETAPKADLPETAPTVKSSSEIADELNHMRENGATWEDLQAYAAAHGGALKGNPADTRPIQPGKEAPIKATPDGGSAEEQLAQEASDFLNKKADVPPTVQVDEATAKAISENSLKDARVKAAVDHINSVTSKWKNTPDITVVKSLDDLEPDVAKSIDPDAIGVVMPEGKVVINMENVDSPDTLNAVLFHETLGHYGLGQKFGDELDNTLVNLYDNTKEDGFKSAVDNWIKENPDAYPEDPNPVARAAEEVLAQMSEKGVLPPSIINTLKNVVKDFGRKLGIDIKYSDREITTILSMAHSAVINGAGRDVVANGFKHMTVWHGTPSNTSFDKFNHDYIGSGEGAQVFGWGTYLSDNKNLADKFYRERLANNKATYRESFYVLPNDEVTLKAQIAGNAMTDMPLKLYENDAVWGRVRRAVQGFLNDKGQVEPTPRYLAEKGTVYNQNTLDKNPDIYGPGTEFDYLAKHLASNKVNYNGKGQLLEVAIPDNASWLELDKPLAGQPKAFSAIRQLARDNNVPNIDGSMSGHDAYKALAKVLGPKKTSIALKEAGIDGNKYLTGLDRSKGSGDYNYVVFDDNVPKIVNRYMKRSKIDNREGTLQGGNAKKDDSLKLGPIRSNRSIEDILRENAPEPTKESWDEWIKTATNIRNKAAAARNLESGSSSAEVLSARTAIVQSANRIADFATKAANGELSVKEEYALMAEIARNADLQDALAGVRSNAARIVNSFRIEVGSNASFGKALNKMMQGIDNNVFKNPEHRYKLFQQIANLANNPQAVNNLIKQSLKPKAEDYIFTVWSNMLLSSPATHTANFVGTLGNFMADMMENTGAAVIGQHKRFSNADRIRGREVVYRVWGALQAVRNAETWANTRETLNTGNSGNDKTGNSWVYSGDNKALQAASGFFESPVRALAGADEWWRNVLHLSNIYGLAVRNAGNKGLKGKAFSQEVSKLLQDPTPEMLEATKNYTKVIQFLDKPSAIANSLNMARYPAPDADAFTRSWKAVLRLAVPFVNTPDSLIRTAIRRIPVLGALERENVNGWKAGGAEKDKVYARMIIGSSIGFWLTTLAMKGQITGNGPADTAKNKEWAATHQPNSIKVGDKWYSIQGLEPVSTNVNLIASLVERFKEGEITQKEYLDAVPLVAFTIGSSLVQNSYLQNFTSLMDTQDNDPNKAQAALKNFMTNIAASATTPAIVRSLANAQDTRVVDTKGDGGFEDRTINRIKAGWPGGKENLPQKFDVYGRPVDQSIAGPDLLTRIKEKATETDPAVNELIRLSDKNPAHPLVGPVGSSVKVNGEKRKLTGEEYQKYQQLAGYWTTESVRQEMASPEWAALSDEEKIKTVKDIVRDMRLNAREYLFKEKEEDASANELGF